MEKRLRILHLEDDVDFVSLVSAMLQEEGLAADVAPVDGFEAFVGALERQRYDLILADYSLPNCNGLQALKAVRQRQPDTPVVLISGTIGEQAAIESLRCGATDYVLKSKMERLVPIVRRALQESAERAQRRQAEQELRESEKQYRLIFDGSPSPMWIKDLETLRFLEVNEAAVQHYGYSREEFLAMTAKEIRTADEAERLERFVREHVRMQSGPSAGRGGLWKHRKKNGELIDVEVKWTKINFKGRPALLIITNDITERKRAAEALEKSQASLSTAQRIANLGSWELDLKNLDDVHKNELRWSDETFRIFGHKPSHARVTTGFFFQAVHPDDRQRVADTFAESVHKRETYDIEHRIILPNGQERVLRERAEVVLDDHYRPVQMRGIVMDITERKQLEEQLRQSQKMEAIGQLAGGVAHDFNNILTVIHGHASLLMEDEKLSKSAHRSAQQIAQATERAAGLTRQLLAFSRRQVMQPRRIDLNEVVSDMTMMLGRILGEDISLQLNYSPHPAFVQADASMIEQVLLNLAINARDALPKGGQLAVRITQADVKPGRHSEARPGRFAVLEVADNGCGIAPENMRRIFEPFFTTKEIGKGTGLGLATVYGVVKQHQGWIEVESETGKGATFRVFLPAGGRGAAARSSKDKFSESAIRGGSETILVVEDELPVRDLVCSVLGGYGYKILQAESGAKALEVWQRHKKGIDLLLTDLVMPDRLNGRELAEKLRNERPALKVIFTSGYSADVVGKDFVLQGELHYLQKPYDPQKLALVVRDCLDA